MDRVLNNVEYKIRLPPAMKEDVPDAVLDIIDWIPDQTRAWESSTNAYITANLSDRLSFTNLVPRKFGNEIRCHFETINIVKV